MSRLLRWPMSIAGRVALGAAVVVAVFVALSAWALDSAFRDSASRAREQRLQAHVYLLMAAAEVDALGRVDLPDDRLDPALTLPASGLAALVLDASNVPRWRSPSALAFDAARLVQGASLAPGAKALDEVPAANGTRWARQRFGVRWAGEGGAAQPLTFVVLEDASAMESMLAQYRRTLWGWLAWLALLLLVVQAAILHWGLRPLRRMAVDLARLESGQRTRLEAPAAVELRPLVANLNAMLAQANQRQQRYRDALADLAHSLKTPLALLGARLREADVPPAVGKALAEPVLQIGRQVDYHLQRAAAAGPRMLAPAQALQPLVERLASALRKVHADKAPVIEVDVPPAWSARIDEGDLTEMLGNLIDNACKWCRHRVIVRVIAREAVSGDEGSPDGMASGVDRPRDNDAPADEVLLLVDDDGPGIDPAVGRRVLQRGVRADEAAPGQGIGLAVVREIAEACGGRIDIGRSPLGGARVALIWPAASRTLGVVPGVSPASGAVTPSPTASDPVSNPVRDPVSDTVSDSASDSASH